MIRAPLGDKKYWDGRVAKLQETVDEFLAATSAVSPNPVYEPQYQFNHSGYIVRLMFCRYSRGDSVHTLANHFPGILDTWERSNRLSQEVCQEHGLSTCRDWDFSLTNLNHYNWCFWLVGLALVLEISDNQWQRLLALVAGVGEDQLLDRVIASRSPERIIGNVLLHPKPYARLLAAVNAPEAEKAARLRDFVDHWYADLKRPLPKNRKDPTMEPFWYIYGDPETHPLEKGSYFGRWCVEAVAAVKAFGMDDSLCLDHQHYPSDLLRADDRKALPVVTEPRRGLLARFFRSRGWT